MESKSYFLVSILLSFFPAVIDVCGATTVMVDISQHRVKAGENVTVKCTVSAMRKSSFIRWMKKQGSVETTIATNLVLEEKFENTRRFSTDYYKKDGNGVFSLIINDAKDEDGGSYGCYVDSKPDTKTYKELTVLAPPTGIRFFSLEKESNLVEYTNGQRVKIRDGESHYFLCMVGPANPAPEVVISYAGQEKTSFFKRKEKAVVIGNETVSSGLVVHKTQVNLTTDAAPINMTYKETDEANAQTVTCRASIPEFKEVAISVHFVIQFAPSFVCDQVVRASLSYKNISIACRVRAKPRLNTMHTKWFWRTSKHHNVTLSIEAGSTGIYKATIKQEPIKDQYIVMLSIEHTTPEVFRKYWLTVSNALGENTREFLLEREKSVIPTASGASVPLATLISLPFLIVRYH